MNSLGNFATSSTIYGKFTTFRPSTGAAYTLGGTPALSVYKDGSDTQSTTGVTLTADYDSVTGLNHYAIDTSADGTFYSAGSSFQVVITTGTVDSISVVGAVVGAFTLDKTIANATKIAGDATGATNLAAAFNLATVGPVPTLGILDMGTAQSASSTGIVGRSAAAFADDTLVGCTLAVYGSTQGYWQSRSITTNLLSGDAYTVDAWSVTPSGTVTYIIFAGPPASATLVPAVNVTQWKGGTAPAMTGDAYASAELVRAVTDQMVFTVANQLDVNVLGIASAVDFSSTQKSYGDSAWATATGFSTLALADFFDTDSGETYSSAVAGSVVKEIADNAGGSALTTDAIAEAMFTYNATADYSTADAGSVVKQIADNAGGSSLTVQDIVDGVMNEAAGAHTGALIATLADTNELQTDWTNGGRLDLLIDAIKAITDQFSFGATNCVDANVKAVIDLTTIDDTTRFTGLTT